MLREAAKHFIERKSGDPATTVELLERLGVVNRVVVQAFDWGYLSECHRLAPNLVLAPGPPLT
jgi:hypothetical protein